MTRHTAHPVQSLRLSPTNEPWTQLISMWHKGALDPNPPYQRDLVWTLDQKISLIYSILDGTPIPAIITNRRGRSVADTRYVIDGKQRLNAVREFLEDKFLVPASWFKPEDVVSGELLTPLGAKEYGDTGLYVAYSGLSDSAQFSLEMAAVPVAEGRFATVKEEAEVYRRVNGLGTPQTADDMARAERVARGE
ncbi:DUF262 domain-containing protein [Microbispora sp. NPDC049125]|uniref:DUF262 domain-containing protein n=1 Tax=Microbispora sp. NPDC049125 TaxID=3154929 RepID=UPI003467C332